MDRQRWRQGVLVQQQVEAIPRHPALAIATGQPATPDTHDPQTVCRQTLAVAGDSVVGAVSAQLSAQCLLLFDQRFVQVDATPLVDGTQPPAQSLARCLALHHPGSLAGAAPVMGNRTNLE